MTPNEIKALRRELGCTAKELASELKLDQATVLAWERAELFPTKQYIDRMVALLARGPGAIPHAPKGRSRAQAKVTLTPIKLLADPALWELLRKILGHPQLRDDVARLASRYSDPASELSASTGSTPSTETGVSAPSGAATEGDG